jgi:hypothetical protein
MGNQPAAARVEPQRRTIRDGELVLVQVPPAQSSSVPPWRELEEPKGWGKIGFIGSRERHHECFESPRDQYGPPIGSPA